MAVATASLYRRVFERLLVVIREDDPAEALFDGFEVLHCADAERGMGHTLATGALAARDWSYLVVALADMPWVRTNTLETIREEITRRGA